MIIDRDVFIERALLFAKEMMMKDGCLCPLVHAEGPHGTHIIALPWQNANDKYYMLGMTKTAFRKLRIDRYLVITEGWVAPTFKSEEEMREAQRRYGPVANMPGRREGIVVAYAEREYREIRTMIVVREGAEERSRVTDFKEAAKTVGKEKLGGDFFELLPDPNVPIDLLTERAIREFLKQFELKNK